MQSFEGLSLGRLLHSLRTFLNRRAHMRLCRNGSTNNSVNEFCTSEGVSVPTGSFLMNICSG